MTLKQLKWSIKASHLIFLITILGLLATGLRIAVTNEPSLIWLTMLLPQGDMHTWHFRFASVFIIALCLYLFALIVGKRLPALGAKTHPNRSFQWSHYVGLLLLASSSLSGLVLYLNIHLVALELVLLWHLISAFLTVVFIIAHSLLAFLARGVWPTIKFLNLFSQATLRPISVLACIAIIVFSVQLWLPTKPTLTVVYTTETVDLDGEARELMWQTAPATKIQTYQGYTQPIQGTQVDAKAARDDDYFYLLVRWEDKTRSQIHLPLLKTEEGWTIVQTDVFNANENTFYEDKLAIMLSETGELGGANTVHLGQRPIKSAPKPTSGRGLHYTQNGTITDVWHWKSVRTGNSIQQVDDNFFGPPSPSNSELKRYTGGYQKDLDDCEHLVRWNGSDYVTKPECGGFVMNWKQLEPGIITPLRLPKREKNINLVQQFDTDVSNSDFGNWWLNWNDTVAYSPDTDTYEVGAIIPSVLSLGPFSQGRGDVDAVAEWRNGYWQLELRRRLTSTSDYDLTIHDGQYIWFATFDHSQTRHSYHIAPIQIRFRSF